MDKGFLNKGSASKTDRKVTHSVKDHRVHAGTNVNVGDENDQNRLADQPSFDMEELVDRMKRIKGTTSDIDHGINKEGSQSSCDNKKKQPMKPVSLGNDINISNETSNASKKLNVDQGKPELHKEGNNILMVLI